MTGGGLETFPFADSQRSIPYGEVNQSFQNNILSAILGQTAQQGPLVPYEGLEKTHEHVNELNLRANLGHYIISEMAQSEVSMAMLWPMVQVRPGLTVFEWTTEKFRPGIAQIVAEEAPSGLQRFSTEPHRVGLDRRGLSCYMTVNTANVEEGLQRIRSQLLKIALTVLNTFEWLVIQTLLTAHDGPRYLDKISMEQFSHSQQTSDSIRGQIEYEASIYAWLNRDPERNMATDMANIDRMLKRYNIQPPFVLLYPEGSQNLLGGRTLDRPGRIDIKTLGPSREIMTMQSMPSYYQLPNGWAFPVKEQAVGDRGGQIQPLLRASMIGEHYIMGNQGRKDVASRTGHQLVGDGFATEHRNIHVYDVELDQYVEVSFAEAFERSRFVEDAPQFGVDIDPSMYPLDTFAPPDQTPRSAPPLYFYEGGRIRRATRFAQLDQNVVSHKLHRCVGETIAAMVQLSKGDPSKDIIKGMQLVEDLEAAPYDRDFAMALGGGIFTNLIGGNAAANLVRLGDVRADIPFPAGEVDGVYLLPQDIQGGLVGSGAYPTTTLLREIAAAIDGVGVPPFMASLSGLQILATLATRNEATGRVLEMGNIAKRFLSAAKRIYASLKNVFPNAMALNPYYRPIGFHQPNGFATFFSAMFLNNKNHPLVYTVEDNLQVISPFMVSEAQRDSVLTDFTETSLQPSIGISGRVTTGGFSTAIGQSVQFAEEDASVPSHKKTPWSALGTMLRQVSAMAGGSAAQRGTRAQQDVDEADLFGTRVASSVPIGAGMPAQFRTRGARYGRTGADTRREDEEPMNADNAQQAWDAADRIENPLVRVCTLVYLTSTCNSMGDFRLMMRANVLVPFGVMLVRPGLTHLMHTLIVAKSGVDVMFHAITDVQDMWGADAGHQTYLYSFTVMHGVVLKSPEAVGLLPNRIAVDYLGGGGTEFYEAPAQLDYNHAQRPDLIPLVVPFDFKPNPYEPIGGIDNLGLYGSPGAARFAGAREHERIWRLADKAVQTRAFGQQYGTAASQVPAVTWTGESLNYNRTLRTPAAGHRRDGSYPGCAGVWKRTGESVFPGNKTPQIQTV